MPPGQIDSTWKSVTAIAPRLQARAEAAEAAIIHLSAENARLRELLVEVFALYEAEITAFDTAPPRTLTRLGLRKQTVSQGIRAALTETGVGNG